MTTTTRRALLLLLLGVLGCSQYSTQEAYEICRELTSPPGTDEAVFADCVACYENCGEDCELVTSETDAYACPDDPVTTPE